MAVFAPRMLALLISACEASATPQLAEVGNQRWQAGPVRSVEVVDGLELGLSRAALPRSALSGAAGCRHSGIAFSLAMALDLSYLHLSRLPVLRISGHTVL